ELNIHGIEIAPTKIWPNWEGASQQNAEIYKKQMADQGFQIPAMQAILFGKPELQLFDNDTHQSFLEHIRLVSDLAAGFGAKVLVFGAPKNRKRGQLATSAAIEIATEFLAKAGEICHANQCCLGLEHNPVEYGCDFVTNASDARQLVDIIKHPGVQLHIDSAGLYMCGGNISDVIKNVSPFVHYHISEPMLEPIAGGVVDHKGAFRVLKEINYTSWYSIEMKQPKTPELVFQSVAQVSSLFADF
ncbi:sugar phosphate isomerase/epimerase family protein, partial [Kaarinaea lacus]